MAARTHDVSQLNTHIATTKWLDDLNAATFAAWPNRFKQYSRAGVLMLSWESGEITNNSTEFRRLESVFRNEFHYEVDTWQIPLKRSGSGLIGRVQKFVNEYWGRDNLLIVYYAGHARQGDEAGSYPIWFASRNESVNAEADTATIGSLLTEGDADAPDVLTLYDCCHPICTHRGTSHSSNAVIESLCAGGFESEVPMPGPDSFTFALIDELSAAASSEHPVSVPELHRKLIRRLELFQSRARWNRDGSRQISQDGRPIFTTNGRRTPVYVSLTARIPIRTIMLRPLLRDTVAKPEVPNHNALSSFTLQAASPTVLLVVRVAEEEVTARGEIRDWLLRSPPGVVEFKGFYSSYSTLILVEIVLEVWDLLPSCPAVTFAGFVNNIEPMTSYGKEERLEKTYQPHAPKPDSHPLTELRNRLRRGRHAGLSNNPQSEQESFAQLMSYANTISLKQLSEWKRLHFQHKTGTSLPSSLFARFCGSMVNTKPISPGVAKCLFAHETFISEYLSTRALIESETASIHVQLHFRYKPMPQPGTGVSMTGSRVLEDLEPKSLRLEPLSRSNLARLEEPHDSKLASSSLIDSSDLESLASSLSRPEAISPSFIKLGDFPTAHISLKRRRLERESGSELIRLGGLRFNLATPSRPEVEYSTDFIRLGELQFNLPASRRIDRSVIGKSRRGIVGPV